MKKLCKSILLSLISILCFTNIVFSAEHHTSWNGDRNVAYEIINNNIPYFTEAEKKKDYFLHMQALDKLGRTGETVMLVDYDKMPNGQKRGNISSVYPSGWKYRNTNNNNKYDKSLVSGGYIYNRCHQLPYQLSGLNAEKRNLFTGTRFININGQKPFEDDVASYVKKTKNHVLYRVTPVFEGNNLICEGVRLEGYSIEDDGEGICFNVFCYNVQPGITIDYLTGENWINPNANKKTENNIQKYEEREIRKEKASSLNISTTQQKTNKNNINSEENNEKTEDIIKIKKVNNKNKGNIFIITFIIAFILVILIIMFLLKDKSKIPDVPINNTHSTNNSINEQDTNNLDIDEI